MDSASNVEFLNQVLDYNDQELREWIIANGKPTKPVCPIYYLEDIQSEDNEFSKEVVSWKTE